MSTTKNTKTIIIAIALIGSFIIVVLIAMIVSLSKPSSPTTLYISAAPKTAKIYLDDNPVENRTEVKVAPGEHTIEAQNEGFTEETLTVSSKAGVTTPVEILLLSTNDDYTIFENSSDDLYLLYKYSSTHPDNETIKQFLEKYEQAAKIQDILPISVRNSPSDFYYILYEDSPTICERIYCLKVGASSQDAANRALSEIRNHGFNPKDYQIITSIGL
ncbi:hypothetical protein IKF63_00200 [Candidatus Saccharibacteria bacterium]|nr:hypothetical protein [Candidatus Saccharibacteria bacterium]